MGGDSSSASCPDDDMVDALVIGSGISGATAAYYLDKSGKNVLLAEARDEVGGNLISKTTDDGFLWEEGPNSFQPNPAILRFAKDMDMIDDLVLADPTLPRFVYWENKLYALPSGLKDLPFFNLLTWPGKIRAGLGAAGIWLPSPPKGEESVKDFVTRHLGEETFTRIIDPFVSGVYAGDPSKLSMQAALKKVYRLEDLGFNRGIVSGALVRLNQIAAEKKANAERDADLPNIPGGSLGTFRRGLQSLPLKVKELLGKKVATRHKLIKIDKDGDGWRATFSTPDGTKTIKSNALIVTAPSYVVAPIVTPILPEADMLKEVFYPPVASVTIAYPNEAFRDGPPIRDGFGHLIPRAMKTRTLGTIWSSSLFPGRAPEGYTLLLNYIGGAQDTNIDRLSKDEIVAQVHSDVKKILLKDNAEPPRVLGCRLWPRAIPQYQKGHLDILDTVETAAKEKAPGLFLGGNYRTGVAFGDCVQYGVDVASEVNAYLDNQTSSTTSDFVNTEAKARKAVDNSSLTATRVAVESISKAMAPAPAPAPNSKVKPVSKSVPKAEKKNEVSVIAAVTKSKSESESQSQSQLKYSPELVVEKKRSGAFSFNFSANNKSSVVSKKILTNFRDSLKSIDPLVAASPPKLKLKKQKLEMGYSLGKPKAKRIVETTPKPEVKKNGGFFNINDNIGSKQKMIKSKLKLKLKLKSKSFDNIENIENIDKVASINYTQKNKPFFSFIRKKEDMVQLKTTSAVSLSTSKSIDKNKVIKSKNNQKGGRRR
jgi:protoporphyrinogen/coproporphyrinogen III oxidase